MWPKRIGPLASFWHLVCAVVCSSTVTAETAKRDVLFFLVDDLRPELGCYGCEYMKTPHIDGLAAESVVFDNMYVSLALCSPSRTAFLTSRRPDTSRVWEISNSEYWRRSGGNFTTLPQYFKESGYLTIGVGKTFHDGYASNFSDIQYSWSPESLPYVQQFPEPDGSTVYQIGADAVYPWDADDEEMGEGKLASHAASVVRQIASKRKAGDQRPYFLAVGFHRPHIPFRAPRHYYEMYDVNMPLAPHLSLPTGIPSVAVSNQWQTYWRKFKDLKEVEVTQGYPYDNTTVPEVVQKKIRQAYRASVSFTDRNIGVVIAELKAAGLFDNAVIAFLGDHGFQLGDNDHWGKHTNFEHATRIPAMMRIPGVTATGRHSNAFVESVDFFPSLVEAATGTKLPLCPESLQEARGVEMCTEGSSLVDLVKSPDLPWKRAAFSQYARVNETVMGYTIRASGWRYTEWAAFNTSREGTGPNWSDLKGVELYSHEPQQASCGWGFEHQNLAEDSKFSAVRSRLSRWLREGWRHSFPPHVDAVAEQEELWV